MAKLIVLVIVLAVVIIFSVQNAMPVVITFLFWNFEASLALVIFLSATCGVLAGAIVMSFMRKKRRRNSVEIPKKPPLP